MLAAVTLLAVALSTGSSIYYLLFFCMAAMLGMALVSVLWTLFTVRVALQGGRRAVERGQSVPLSLTVRHFCLLPVRSVELSLYVPEDEGAQEAIEIYAPPFVEKKYDCVFPCPHRGIYHVGLSALRVTDVFSLVTLRRGLRGKQSRLEVRPRTRRIAPIELRPVDAGPQHISRATEDNASPSDVRQWVEGDALKKVHWKLTMKKRELMVRTYEESARPDTLILLDLSPLEAPLRKQALDIEDAACEMAASVALSQLQAGYPVRMPLLSKDPAEAVGQFPADAGRFVDQLMRVNFDSPYPYEQVLALEMRRMQRTGGAVLITPRLTARIADVAIQLHRNGMQVSVIWVTESRRAEAMEMLSRLSVLGILTQKVDPWG